MRITKELLDLCIDYDRHAKEYAVNVKGNFKRFEDLCLSRMEHLDKELAKFEV